uniref:hypothetical protein n=1 Tax=uncultured Sphingomonas sp. TaxID=158754 RepID=UPI0035CC71CE
MAFGIVIDALYKKRVFPFIWRHPDGAVHLDYQPRTYWFVTGFYATVGILVLFGLLSPQITT